MNITELEKTIREFRDRIGSSDISKVTTQSPFDQGRWSALTFVLGLLPLTELIDHPEHECAGEKYARERLADFYLSPELERDPDLGAQTTASFLRGQYNAYRSMLDAIERQKRAGYPKVSCGVDHGGKECQYPYLHGKPQVRTDHCHYCGHGLECHCRCPDRDNPLSVCYMPNVYLQGHPSGCPASCWCKVPCALQRGEVKSCGYYHPEHPCDCRVEERTIHHARTPSEHLGPCNNPIWPVKPMTECTECIPGATDCRHIWPTRR